MNISTQLGRLSFHLENQFSLLLNKVIRQLGAFLHLVGKSSSHPDGSFCEERNTEEVKGNLWSPYSALSSDKREECPNLGKYG